MAIEQTITREEESLAIIEQFNAAWNARDLDTAVAMLTDDFVFENTAPAPDGERFIGREAARAAWKPVFETPGMRFETEELIACGERVTGRWTYFWQNEGGSLGHVRGVDVFRIHDGNIAEKLSYVKG